MSHLNPGLISAYNSLTDKHLAGYFSNTRIRRHLQRAGLITRSGRIVPDKEYRHKLIQRAHQRHIRECLAQAIFHKVLEMERLHQMEIKRKLEEFARSERVHKIKVERSKRYEEDNIIRILSPRPPTGARGVRKQHSGPEGEHSESSESPSSSRPNTAPGKMQRPVRLKPINSYSTTATVRRGSPCRQLESLNGNEQPIRCTMHKEYRRRQTPREASQGISPYCLPVINNFVTPVPPATKRKDRGVKVTRSSTIRGRRLHPTTASSGADVSEDPPMLRSSIHQSKVTVNMVYFGKTVHLSLDLTHMRDDVKVFQQHCGGENLCVFKGKLREGEMFQFISRRHRGFPFSLTFFLNGLQVERLSSCCEFRHRKGPRLGGKHGHFGFCSVEGASPCYKCIIAMGLDKKPAPPPKRVKGNTEREQSMSSLKASPEVETERMGDDDLSHSDGETGQPRDMDTDVEDKTTHRVDKVRDDYEEDFEADDEAPAENEEAGEEKSTPLLRDTERQLKEKDVTDTEDEEKDEDIKSRSGSSGSSGSDQEESEDETAKDTKEEEKEQPEEVDEEKSVTVSKEKEEGNVEYVAAAECESDVVKVSNMQNSAGDSAEIEISDSGGLSTNEKRQSDGISGEKDAENTVDESNPEEQQERAKSVQEKLADVTLKESQCNSEPELRDTSAEESVEEPAKQQGKGAFTEKLAEHQQTIVGEMGREESASGGTSAAQKEETESKEQDGGVEESIDNIDSIEDEKVNEAVEDEKAAGDEAKAEQVESESVVNTNVAPESINEEIIALDETSSDSPIAKSMGIEAFAKDNTKEGREAKEVHIENDDEGQRIQNEEEGESSVSEANHKTVALDNVESEAMTASETTEINAESSEKQEALSCEEAPVTDAEKPPQAESEDGTAASGTEDTVQSLTEETADTAVDKTADGDVEKLNDVAEENANDEESKDEVKEESETAGSARDSQGQSEVADENTAIPEINGTLEEHKSEEHHDDLVKLSLLNSHEMAENKNTLVEENGGMEGNEEGESKAAGRIGKEENLKEDCEDAVISDTKEVEDVEETLNDQDGVAEEEGEKAQEDRETECYEREKENEGFVVKGDGENNDDKDPSEKSAAVDVKDDAEKSEGDDKGCEAGQDVSDNKDHESREDVTDKTAIETIELSKNTDEENVKKSDQNIQSEGVVESDSSEMTKCSEKPLDDIKEDKVIDIKPEEASSCKEKGEIDAENGEMSAGAESDAQLLEEAEPTDRRDFRPRQDGEEIKTEDPYEGQITHVQKTPEASGEGVKEQADHEGDHGSGGDVVETVKSGEEERDADKNDKSAKDVSELENSCPGMTNKLDNNEVHEATGQDENSRRSDRDGETDVPDLTEKENVSEATALSSIAGEQCSAPVSAHSDHISRLFDQDKDESSEASESQREHLPRVAEHVVSIHLSAMEEENGADMEETSKASEEGASVLLKPHTQNNGVDESGQSVTVVKRPPEALATADNTDLVTNWINTHQSSKYFETFVEPLEDLRKISDDQIADSKKEEERPKSETFPEEANILEEETQSLKLKDENQSGDQTQVEAVESDLHGFHTEDKAHENYSINQTPHLEDTSEVKDLSETEQSDRESATNQDTTSEAHNSSRLSLQEDRLQEGARPGDSEENAFSKTEVESISATLLSVASHKAGSVSENQPNEKTTNNGPDFSSGQTTTRYMKEASSEDFHNQKSSDRLKGTTWERTDVQSQESTEVRDPTASKSNKRCQEEPHGGESEAKVSDESGSKDRNELIQDIKHTLSKERLNTFLVDETLFACSSYTLLTTARTESGH